MTVTLAIATTTAAEWEALDSEGAPSANMTASNMSRILTTLDAGVEPGEWGEHNPSLLLMGCDDALSRAQSDSDISRILAVQSVCRAAVAVGRHVSWG